MKASLIIPSYNACERLYYNLVSLNMQSCDRHLFEVIVVDDGSKDNTKQMLANLNANYKLKKIVLKENKGRANARNTAINEAKGDILIFHDSDMIAEKDYVTKHIKAHSEGGTVVSGMNWNKVYTYYYKDFTAVEKQKLENQLKIIGLDKRNTNLWPILDESDIKSGKCFEYAFMQSKYQNTEDTIINSYGSNLEGYFFPWIIFVTNNCSAFRNDVIKAGCFDTAFLTWGCEDLDLGYRLYKNNCCFVKAFDINSLHQEHPVNHRKSVSDNIYLFTKKYDSIDLLLFYYGSNIGVINHSANVILGELEELKKNVKYHWFIELYRKLLINLRDSYYNFGRNRNIYDTRQLKESITSVAEAVHEVLSDLENRNFLDISASFKHLLKKALGPNTKAIRI